MLSSGPGPGPLLAAAGAWNSLSSEYTAVAEELSTLVAAVQTQSWQGSAGGSYAAANAPYVAWLTRAAADAAATAAQHEAVAIGYATAQASMPTLGELAANHATHAVLLATNFFGINTIPIALNEADYARMWVQAATTMTVYQNVSAAAVTATPRTEVAPPISKASPAASADPLSSLTEFLTQVEQIFNRVGGGGNQSLLDYLFSVPPGTDPLSLILNDISVASSPTSGYPALLQALVGAAGNNPALIAAAYAFGGVAIVYDVTIQVIQFLVTFPLLAAGLAPLVAGPALAGLAAAGSVGIAEIAAHVHAGAEPAPTGPTAPAIMSPTPVPAPGATAAAPAPAALTPAPAPAAPMPPASPAAPAGPGAPPPGGTPAGPLPYLMGGWIEMASPATTKARMNRKSPAPEIADIPAASAASIQEKTRARRQRRAKVEVRGRGYEYMDLDDNLNDNAGHGPDAAPTTTASDLGAQRMGFAATARRSAVVDAAGLTMLAGDEFGSGPSTPMIPSTWTPDGSGEVGSR